MGLSTLKALGGVPSLEILVVDDDELNQRMMRVLLTREGHHVEAASNGLEALEAVKAKKYDIVFMDLQMPVMDGIEASKRIRSWENGGMHTFIVALTASYFPEQGHELFEAGMDNYISKPFEVEHIQKLLKYSTQARLQPSSGTDIAPAEDRSVRGGLDTHLGIRRVGGDSQTYRELLADFVQGLPEKVRLIRKACEAKDMERLSRAAHNLKGVSANLGATQLSDLARRLDEQSGEGYTETLAETLREIEGAAKILCASADDFLNKKER